ncbi:MAG: hypothetical protein K5762_04520 [Bacilli bacterium]|nr:hypothetical protein [Bacilli bacterium]
MKTKFIKALGLSLLMLLSSCGPKEKSPEERLSEIAEEKATLNGFILESEKGTYGLRICYSENGNSQYCIDTEYAFINELKDIKAKPVSKQESDDWLIHFNTVVVSYRDCSSCFLLKETLTAFVITSSVLSVQPQTVITAEKGYEISKETGEKLLTFVKDMMKE